jgi:hypothetical protein
MWEILYLLSLAAASATEGNSENRPENIGLRTSDKDRLEAPLWCNRSTVPSKTVKK